MTSYPQAHTELREALAVTNPEMLGTFDGYSSAIMSWMNHGLFPRESFMGRAVLDAGCGDGLFAGVLSVLGAKTVDACDPYLPEHDIAEPIRRLKNIRFQKCYVADLPKRLHNPLYDLIFCCTVTEHVLNPAEFFISCHQVLAPGGVFFFNHDNYYQPVGSHDHGMLFLDPKVNQVVPQGPKCWESADKCATSADYRHSLKVRNLHWSDACDAAVNPADCTQCPYYRRSKPWAHLLYQDSFRETFPDEFFTTGHSNAGLSKVTPFQLRQFLIEAGFDVKLFEPFVLSNQAPPELLAKGFSERDLLTFQITGHVVKPSRAA